MKCSVTEAETGSKTCPSVKTGRTSLASSSSGFSFREERNTSWTYFILRNAIDEPERRATYGAVLSIIALIDVPICFMVTRLIPSSIHPVVVREGGMSADMGITLMFCLVGIMLIGFALYRFRFRQVRLTERVEALKEQLED